MAAFWMVVEMLENLTYDLMMFGIKLEDTLGILCDSDSFDTNNSQYLFFERKHMLLWTIALENQL